MYRLNLDIQDFLAKHWQQQPLVIKAAFPDFEDPIAADELAGLACEEEISSRIVVTKDHDAKQTTSNDAGSTQESDWEVVQGPFEDYDNYGETHWQLLVQAVNHWYPDAQPLVEAFRFLPDWRFDDLMASFATPKGGVGPHVDNYDVFIIQGEGQRRWKVGAKGNHKPRGEDPLSPLVEDFEPIIDVVLEKGDVLYIPPGFPHCGETLSLAMSYSIGFRAPSQQELVSEVADYLLDNNLGQQRFTSTDEPTAPGLVSVSHQQGIMSLLAELSQDPGAYQGVLGKLLSQNRFELDICEGEEAYSFDDLQDALNDGAIVARIGGLKVLRLEHDLQPRLFINGEAHLLEGAAEEELALLSNGCRIDADAALALCNNPVLVPFLLKMLNQGYFYLTEE
jgi:50S ribosomal protein L16 3-hydroxylase